MVLWAPSASRFPLPSPHLCGWWHCRCRGCGHSAALYVYVGGLFHSPCPPPPPPHPGTPHSSRRLRGTPTSQVGAASHEMHTALSHSQFLTHLTNKRLTKPPKNPALLLFYTRVKISSSDIPPVKSKQKSSVTISFAFLVIFHPANLQTRLLWLPRMVLNWIGG